jgi:hypothetical protein
MEGELGNTFKFSSRKSGSPDLLTGLELTSENTQTLKFIPVSEGARWTSFLAFLAFFVLLQHLFLCSLYSFIVLKAGAGKRESWSEGSTGFSGNVLDDATVFCTGGIFLANSMNLRCLPRTQSMASSCSSTNLCMARSGSAVGQTLTFFRSIHSFSMLKGAFVELDPDMDCIGRVTAFEYVILDGQMEAMEMGAVRVLVMVHQ